MLEGDPRRHRFTATLSWRHLKSNHDIMPRNTYPLASLFCHISTVIVLLRSPLMLAVRSEMTIGDRLIAKDSRDTTCKTIAARYNLD